MSDEASEPKYDDDDGYAAGTSYGQMGIYDLRKVATSLGVSWRGLRKADLVDAVKEAEAEKKDPIKLAPEKPKDQEEDAPPPNVNAYVAAHRGPAVIKKSVQYYEVQRTSRYCPKGGLPTRVRKGALVSQATHDLDALKAQGVPMQATDRKPGLERDAYGQIKLPHNREIAFPRYRMQGRKVIPNAHLLMTGHPMGLREMPDGEGGTELELSDEARDFEHSRANPKLPMGGSVD